LGYGDVVRIHNGLPGWIAAGGHIFQGTSTPGKALGLYAQRELAIPEIGPEELARLLQKERSANVIDCRPSAEYQRGCIPGAANCPGVELLRHLLAPDGMTVINCAGRTRGLLGVQTLIDFGFAGRVVALRDGTMGWELAGHDLERSAARGACNATGAGAQLREIAERIRWRTGIQLVYPEDVGRWRADPNRTTYVFDIREAEEYRAGHVPGAHHVAGGQLIQNFDQHVATLGSRVVLADDDGVRATATALWLHRLGWRDIAVVQGSDAFGPLKSDSDPGFSIHPPDAPVVTAPELKSMLDRGSALLVDLAMSRDYRNGHIPGAWFAIRSRLAGVLPSLPQMGTLILTSDDGVLAAFASTDEIPFGGPVRVLEGGTAAWRQAGYPLSKSLERVADEMDDVVLKPSELAQGRDSAMRNYLSDSDRLLDRIHTDGTLHLTPARVTW
jgi:rhodanese-related sulfurtransferase